MSNEEDDIEIDPIDHLKSLNLEDFLNCKTTNQILLENHFIDYEVNLKSKLKNLYIKYNTGFRDLKLFGKDWENKEAERFSHLIYNYIARNYNLNIFYENPNLASDLFKSNE